MPLPTTIATANWMHEPLAIVGMACRLPGGDDLDKFWQLLESGGNAIDRLPDSFFDRTLYFHRKKGIRGRSYSDVGGLIAERELDWSIMPVDRGAADQWDPCHLILCEVAAAACLRAGFNPRDLAERSAGVYIGHSGGSTTGGELAYRTLLTDYVDLLEDLPQWQRLSTPVRKRVREELLGRLRAVRPSRSTGGGPMVDAGCAAGLISHAFGLTGPHMSIDAACASSLVALALSAAALHSGQIEMAVVGGASFNKFDSLILFSQAQSCSASSSRPFDAAADGLISSEGYVVFIMKTLEKALANGDRIEAVIRGIGLSSDGRGRSLWAPRKEGQRTAIERAYHGEVTADSVQLVEAHATSTQVGDATELEALSTFFKERLRPDQRLPIGSVKSNIGHTLETAGLAGLVKAVLAIQHGVIPPSVNVERLNESIAWDEIPLFVPRSCQAWPALPLGQRRRAAVNAFGIGGLNVHVVVEQYLTPIERAQSGNLQGKLRSPGIDSDPEKQSGAIGSTRSASVRRALPPIAVVGRGMVVPGALNVAAFAKLLVEQISPLVTPPRNRWRTPGSTATAASADTPMADRLDVVGGYITQFAYDWRKHKVPPKQIAQANPLQFMLLEAAEQALREAGYLDKPWDKQRAAVIVGSVFGGDFGNALYAGLRLPEFKRELSRLLTEHTLNHAGDLSASFTELLTHYEEHFLKTYPALLDETGSFTSSTLASRLSKTFDLMGGALAIDAGEASSLAALDASVNLLRSGTIDHVLCATGQHALDRASLERLALSGRLVARGSFASAGDTDRRHLASSVPAEGVALVLLKRLDDALAAGDTVYATIHDVTASMQPHGSVTASTSPIREPRPTAIETIGNLQGAQGIVDLIELSLPQSANNQVTQVAQLNTTTGLQYRATVSQGISNAPAQNIHLPMNDRVSQPLLSTPELSPPSSSKVRIATAVSESAKILRIVANDSGTLIQRLNVIGSKPWSEVLAANAADFGHTDAWRAALVVTPSDYQAKSHTLAGQIGQSSANVPLAEQGLFWSSPAQRSARIAWLFPGQGSQYTGMLRDLVANEPRAAAALMECDRALAALGQPCFAELAWGEASQLGENVWHTQASMLVADYLLMSTLRGYGCVPDMLAGHSFGEFAAMLAAGCWDIESALLATWHRCRSIVEHVPAACGMLSIQAAPDVVAQLIRVSRIAVSISHRNAPEQTVVGGKQAAVAQFAQIIDNEGITSRLLAVPTAFHTPALADAQAPFAAALQTIAIRPPTLPLLSSVNNRFVAEPAEIRHGLVTQLVTPLDFVSLVERLISQEIGIVVEIGPQQVLTRLTRQIAGAQLHVLSTDHPKRGCAHQLLCARAGLEVLQASTPGQHSLIASHANAPSGKGAIVQTPLHFDATAERRQRAKQSAEHARSSMLLIKSQNDKPKIALQFDASQLRRDRNRQQPSAIPSASLSTTSDVLAHTHTAAAQSRLSEQGTPSQPSETPYSVSALSSAAPANPAGSNDRVIESFLIDFVVEQTGYPAEIIELDWDIEADLGIDSIKKAQLFGELREFFDLESIQKFSLDNFKTLRDIVRLLVSTPGKGDWLQQRSEGAERTEHSTNSSRDALDDTAAATPATALLTDSGTIDHALTTNGIVVSRAAPPARSATSAVQDAGHMQQFLIDFVVEQTGYPAEIVELDADLEADLGIDSIKKAQLFGELREMFTLPGTTSSDTTSTDKRLSLSEFRTLRSVLELLLASTPQIATVAVTHVEKNCSTIADDLPESLREDSVNEQAVSDQFRNLVPLVSRDASPAGVTCELPLVIFGREIQSNRGYADASLANLQALAGRPHHPSNDRQVHYNGERERVTESVTRLAALTGTADVSLLALDACMLAQAQWKPWRSEDVDSSMHAANQPSQGLRPILEYCVPKWLSAGGGIPLSAHVYTTGGNARALALLTPGCVTACVVISETGHVFAAGQLPSSHDLVTSQESAAFEGHCALKLNQWLHVQATSVTTLQEFETAARAFQLPCDWWTMSVDLSSTQRLSLESREGVVVIEKGRLPTPETLGPLPVNTAARLVLDTQRGELLVQAQLLPLPHACSESRLPITDLRAWAREQSVLGSHAIHGAVDHAATAESTDITQRYVLRMVPSPQRPTTGRRPAWSGAALIIGDNPVATQLEARLRSAQLPVTRWAGTEDPNELARRFDELSKQQSFRHLFLTTPCDVDARSAIDQGAWQRRRNVGLMSTFWLCQRWHQHVCASGWVDDASLVAITSLGGDFGVNGRLQSVEGGALTGLLKSILIESWVQGFRTFPIKVLDTSRDDSPAQIVNHVWQELAVPSFDVEVAYRQGVRHVLRAIAAPLKNTSPKQTSATRSNSRLRKVSSGGNWVCTGGARGITAYVAEQLAKTYGLTLHLLGTSPLPVIDSSWRNLDEASLRELKARVMTSARTQGKNPVTTWQDTEKALEIDRTLRSLNELGIAAHYHQCDVSNRDQVARTLDNVREKSGPIHGVLHGAGVGKDARFDRKQPDKVQQCIGAKVDGAWSLIEATWNDPLEAFVGFGSISGRFGANGHTDYSLANDMLCKQMDWLRGARPNVHSIGFHWHAWGDIGMATKPETRLALEMIQMQFMPAVEGVQHLLDELESDSVESEVLITDERYYRLFYSPDAHTDSRGRSTAHLPPPTPLLLPAESKQADDGRRYHTARLEPSKDPFLTDHRLDARPLLPIVIGTELLLEAARAHLGHTAPLKLRDVRALQGLRFFSDQPQLVRIATTPRDEDALECQLLSDFHARDGRLVERDRVNLVGIAERLLPEALECVRISLPGERDWDRPQYPAVGDKFYVGLPLQRLRGYTLTDAGLVGRITAPALIELAGGSREVRGWQLPSAAMDACLFAAGILAWQAVAPGSALPTGFGEIVIGRLPLPGEACEVHVCLREHSRNNQLSGTKTSPTADSKLGPGHAAFDFTLYGVDNDVLLNVRNYRVAWLVETTQAGAVSSATVAG